MPNRVFTEKGLPNDLLTSEIFNNRRLKVENDDPSYTLGTQFRISYPLTVTNGSPIVLRFTSAIDFELISQTLETHESGIVLEAYRDTQGVESGAFGDIVPTYRNNFQSTAINYVGQVVVETGGVFTPDIGQAAVETVNVLSANANSQRSTVEVGTQGKRGLGAGVYYLRFSKLGGAGTALGVYSLIFDENP